MRSKEEIRSEIRNAGNVEVQVAAGVAMIAEMLCDIRDLLTKHEPTANPADPQGTEGSQTI